MKKILHKLKSVNKQIAEYEKELVNINNWPEKTWREQSDKKKQLEMHDHFMKELKEEKLVILSRLEDAIQIERVNILTSLKNDNTPSNEPSQPSFS